MSGVMIYDAIVVGAGIEGSSTAYQLAKKGRRVLLLEQYKLGHDKGSSHSLTRITRKAYGTQDFFTVMMEDAYRRTDELQTECGEQLFINTGCMIIGRKGDDFVEGTEDSLQRHNVPYERFDQIHSKQRLPSLCFPDNYDFIIDRSGGVLRADRILRAFQVGFQKYGGIIRDEEEMLNIRHGNEIVVQTNKETYIAKSLVLTLGPWASTWLPRLGLYLPLKPMRVLVCYWKEKNPGEFSYKNFPTFIDITADLTKDKFCVYGLPSYERPGYVKAAIRYTGSQPMRVLVCYWKEKNLGEFSYENFPTFIDITADLTKDKFCVYGLPSYERPGYVKICLDGGPPVDPDTFTHDDTGYIIEALCEYVTKHFPTLENKPSFVEPCYYTNTPDEAYILDIHPFWRNVVIGAGFSGQGFKLAPVVGCILADLAEGRAPEYEMQHFRIDRFNTNT